MKLKNIFGAGLLAPMLFITGSAQAASVSGQANIAGNVTVTANAINFAPTFVNTPGAMETGSFFGLTGGSIMSLSGGPVTGGTNVSGFIHFDQGVASPITFDLNYIAPGVGTLAACGSSALGAECTPAGSPFTLIQLTSDTVVATLQLNGNAYTGSAASGSSATRGIFSTQSVVSGTIPQLIGQLQNGGSISGVTYSASFEASPVPEPGSMLLMGLGLAGAGLIARRKVSKA
jgi:hypothetical protein